MALFPHARKRCLATIPKRENRFTRFMMLKAFTIGNFLNPSFMFSCGVVHIKCYYPRSAMAMPMRLI